MTICQNKYYIESNQELASTPQIRALHGTSGVKNRGRAPHRQITGGELLQNKFKMSVN